MIFLLSAIFALCKMYEIWGVWQRPPVKISGNMLHIIKKAVDILKNVHPWEQDYGGYQHFYPDYSYNYSSPVHTQSHRHKRVFTDDISLGKPDVQQWHTDNSDHNPSHQLQPWRSPWTWAYLWMTWTLPSTSLSHFNVSRLILRINSRFGGAFLCSLFHWCRKQLGF